MTERYDEKKKTLWVASSVDGDTLIPNEQVKTWITALQKGELDDGKKVESIHVVFQNADGAEYNQHALGFAKVGTFVGTLEKPKKYNGDEASFETKEDFGVS